MAVDAVVPDEIIVEEILTRVTVKSLARFRCVCKSWNSQLYNPNFLSRFNHHHRSSSVSPELIRDDDYDDDYLVFMNSYPDRRETGRPPYGPSILSCKKLSETCLDENHNYVPYPLSLGDYGLELVGSINGLVCMAFRIKGNHQFVLWNPIIRFFKKISMVGIDINRCYSLVYGFGWDSVTNDYKLIASPKRNADNPFLRAVVYSCKTDCWSNINSMSINLALSYPSVIVNGSPYWYIEYSIQKFDTSNNEFTCLTNAPSRQGPDHSGYVHTSLINLNDCLAFIEYNTYRGVAKVYRYDEQHNIWMNMYTFDKYTNHDEFQVHCFKYGGEIVFHGKKHRYLYDPNKSREIKSRLRRCPGCGGCLARSRKRKRRGSHDDDEGDGCGYEGGHVVNGFSYTPSLVALPGMKALHM